MGGTDESKSMGNRLLSDASDTPGINLPDRVELVTELGHFVGGLPSGPGCRPMLGMQGGWEFHTIGKPLKINYGVGRAAHKVHGGTHN